MLTGEPGHKSATLPDVKVNTLVSGVITRGLWFTAPPRPSKIAKGLVFPRRPI
jgi:hypothetical protein